MRQLFLILLLSVAMLCSAATAKYCSFHEDCETHQACSQEQCVDLCFSDNCNKGVNNARDTRDFTPLHQAARKNSVDVAKRLLENSANVDSSDKWGRTALHYAALKNSVDVAQVLIENSANVDNTNNWGKTALHYAALKNSVEVAKRLLENSANVDSTDKYGRTALHWAAEKNSVDMAEVLIENSANLNATAVSGDYKGLTPLQVAKKEGHQEMVKLLRNTCRFHGECSTTQACSQSKCVDLCFSEDCNQGVNNARDSWEFTPLHRATRENSVDVAKRLLENSANVDSTDKRGETALHWAAFGNSVDVAKLLLAKSANLNAIAVSGWARGLTPLQVAEERGNQEMVELLRNAMAKDCRYHGDCGTTQACSQRKCTDLCFCDNCNTGVNNARDEAGSTPLIQAAKTYSAFAARLLLAHSADVDSSDKSGRTALHIAARWNRVDVTKVLLENSANVDSTTNGGTTPLHVAALNNNVELAKVLIENSANVDSTDNYGQTALHEAAIYNSVDVAKLLLKKSANLNATAVSGSYKGLTPLQVAERKGNQQMVELLKNA